MQSAPSLTPTWKPDWRSTEAELHAIFGTRAETFRSVIEPRAAAHVPWAGDLADVKRFGERWRADRAFRAALPTDPHGVAARYGLRADAEALRPLWDGSAKDADPATLDLAVQRHKLFIREKLLHREKLRRVECVPADERHRRWRDRQINRTLGHLGPRQYDGIVHAPFAIELSDGCSVGCWFCGVSAEKKRADFRYTDDNARLWREVLTVLRNVVGTAAATGFCYWATDPLDNPDYERFCLDVAAICGRFPQTTTAQPHRDPERVRRLLALSTAHGCTINRFSILSLSIFDRVMAAFTPDELLHCELVPQNPEANLVPSNAGRARGSARLKERIAAATGAPAAAWEDAPGTIACISGFLLNMVRRTVKLITPCPATERWPDGYWVLGEGRFDTAAELATLLEDLMARHMPTALRADHPGRFRPDVVHRPLDDGFALAAHGATITLRGAPYLREAGELLAAGDRTIGAIALALEDRFDRPAANTMHVLNQVFDGGYLDEEPR